MVKILGISGSPRRGGNTDVILDSFLAGARQAGAETVKVCLRDYAIHGCVGCEKCAKDRVCKQFQDGMQLLYPLIEDVRGMVIGSPAYNLNITPEMKAFIDRMYPFYEFTDDRPRQYRSYLEGQGRKAITFAVCEQTVIEDMGVTLEAMSKPMGFLGHEVICEFPVLGQFERGIVKREKDRLAEAVSEGKRLVEEISRKS
jgi:multimeric flavodoxin WrbA